MRMHPPLFSCAHFRTAGACGHLHHRLSLCPTVPCPDGKDTIMKLKIRYDNAYQTLELDAKETEQLWISLDLDGEGLTQQEREELIQKTWEERFNRPEYNNWHKHSRHRGESKAKPGKDETEDDVDTSEPLMSEVADDRIFRQDELSREEQESYEAICSWIREILAKKPNWAEAFIAVRMDGMTVNEYAAATGQNAYNVSKYLTRAEKILKENSGKRQI